MERGVQCSSFGWECGRCITDWSPPQPQCKCPYAELSHPGCAMRRGGVNALRRDVAWLVRRAHRGLLERYDWAGAAVPVKSGRVVEGSKFQNAKRACCRWEEEVAPCGAPVAVQKSQQLIMLGDQFISSMRVVSLFI
ncbi:hypothetical protein DdX_06576 [Ditylenchus destructor]|uniref:Uncharacterized protein n=1 Tax=Ditylenchus destructor TaxID=166010 RepID=A0AAD4R931_9BILA|nr:hypothetical protein DdX_06576 [Ditylenchus destructor]